MSPGPSRMTVRFESEPAGAEAKVASGESCRTPCSLPLAVTGQFNTTFTLEGFQPQTVTAEVFPPEIPREDPNPRVVPNPVFAELEPAPPAARRPPPKQQRKQPATKRPAASSAPRAAAPATATGQAPAPAASQAPPPGSPWPPAPQPQR
jgi:hypothetical protein